MSWDEPRAIARQLAASLRAAPGKAASDGDGDDGVLLLDETELAALPEASLHGAAAVVVRGRASEATSAGAAALRTSVAARGLEIGAATFATVPDTDGKATEVPLVIGIQDSERGRQVLVAGPRGLPLDATVDVHADGTTAAARVCVVSFEVSGMTGGGIGTASTALAESLARSGHDVTLLFTGWQETAAAERNDQWRAHYAERGVQLAFVRRPGASTVKNPHFPARSAYEVYAWLRREQPFDVVHLPENMGHGVYAQLAKRQGLRFASTTFVVGTHGPTRWAAEANRVALTREEFLVNEAFERMSVACADVLLGPSRYLHDYMRARGWQLPERVHVQPYAAPSAVRDARAGGSDSLPSEIVFFGRLETRKGVALLCDALDLLATARETARFEVTFLGPVAEVLGEAADAYIARRAQRWPWRWRIVSDRDQQAAARYLQRAGVLAVMPSLVDNAPNTVSEAVALGIPFVAARTGGTGELVAAEQRDDHMFDAAHSSELLPSPLDQAVPAADPRPLADLLRRRLQTPVAAARPLVDCDAVDAAYDTWHRAVRAAHATAERCTLPETSLPPLSVCVLFDGDDALLGAQLDALDDDDLADVMVVDLRADRQDVPEAVARRGVELVRAPVPAHAAAARTAAVGAARAELVAILPPGDVPLPGFAHALRRAAATTDADVYSCAVLDRLQQDRTDAEEMVSHAFVPLVGPPLLGLTHPAFAVGPYAIRRAALERVGGFAADARDDEVDHELLNRAAAGGLRIEPIAEPLAAKHRGDRWVTFRSSWRHPSPEPPYDAEQWLRVMRPLAAASEGMGDVVGLLHGARTDSARLEHELHEQHSAYEARSVEQQAWIQALEDEAVARRAEHAAFTAEVEQLRRQADEMSQSAGQLAVRTVRDAGRKLARRLRR